MEIKLSLSKYGFNMGSRLLGRDIVLDAITSIEKSDNKTNVEIDFSGIRYMSLSFATEVIYTLFECKSVSDIRVVNALPTIQKQIDFAVKYFHSKSSDPKMHVLSE